MSPINVILSSFLSGMAMLGSWVAGIYFFRFWLKSRDRLFLMFGASFWLMALERLALAFTPVPWREEYSFVYIIRLVAFLIIIVAIVDKNRQNTFRG